MSDDKVKVLYIAGWGRSGSTILANIFGQLDGFFFAGELPYVWDRGLIENRYCGCGQPFRECPAWMSIMEAGFGGMEQVDARRMSRLPARARTRHLPLMLLPGSQRWLMPRLADYSAAISSLYSGIRSATGARVIVDSSKSPAYSYLLGHNSSISLYVVHLIRDPRGVTYSWLKKLVQPDRRQPALLKRHHPVENSLIWNAWNIAVEALWRRRAGRYMQIRYEDFVQQPRRTVERILDMLGEPAAQLPFVDEHAVTLTRNHSVSGNPNRFQEGVVGLHPDEEWRQRLKRSQKALVTALTWPLLLRYGYLRSKEC